MAKKIMKSKLIKRYFGDVIKEDGFEYAGADSMAWKFTKQKGKVRQEIYIVQDRFLPNKIGMFLFTGVYGWGTQQPCDFVEKYKNKEYWDYETEEEFVVILQEFAAIVKEYGLEMLNQMCTPKDPIYPTPEMNRYLYESYESLIERIYMKYDFEKTGEAGIKNISMLLYQNKDVEFNEVKDFLIDMAVLYIKIMKDDIGGSLILENDMCILGKIGKNKREILPLADVISIWKYFHNGGQFKEDNGLLIGYRQMSIC